MKGSLSKRPTTGISSLPSHTTSGLVVRRREVGEGLTSDVLRPLLTSSGATYIPTSSELKELPIDVVYEMAYGGSKNGYFSSNRFAKYREIEDEYLETLIRGAKVVEGITDCPKCGSDRILKVIVSIRSGDEPDVNILTCTKCSNRWTVSK